MDNTTLRYCLHPSHDGDAWFLQDKREPPKDRCPKHKPRLRLVAGEWREVNP